MRHIILILLFLIVPRFAYADNGQGVIILEQKGGNHSEYYIPADMPEVYFDSDEMEIIIVAEGFADYYTVEVNSMVSGLTLIYTQIRGYGDTIDVSSLPDGYYQIIITSSNNNMFEGTFLIEKINRFLR